MFSVNNNLHENPSIMRPMESLNTVKAELTDAMRPDIINDAHLVSIPYINADEDLSLQSHQSGYENNRGGDKKSKRLSFQLIGRSENLLITNKEDFVKKLGCSDTDKIKVVSIFGNTGDGKSHTMNSFFNGEEVFRTSAAQTSCTIGVFAAMHHKMGILFLDTEGFLGTDTNPDTRLRMSLKILAVSDVVILRTKAERLDQGAYQFLDTASRAFQKYFSPSLQSLDLPDPTRALGPAVIIFHETKNTDPFKSTVEVGIEDILRTNFLKMKMHIDAFSSIRYFGQKINGTQKTNYSEIRDAVITEISNKSVRSPRKPKVIFEALEALNLKFSESIESLNLNPFPEQYFTCSVKCESCEKRCQRSMGHKEIHENSSLCIYQHQFDNKVYLCKKCHQNGKKVIVNCRAQSASDNAWTGLLQYTWKGAVIECPNCGEIYRSRQYWYGNKNPEDEAVRPETVHVWRGCSFAGKAEVHSGQMLLDGVNYLSGAIGSVVQQPTKALTDWVADKTAPSYWKPNADIVNCHSCRKNFERTGLQKHHCRSCGEGFCHPCSQHKMPVPSRGWDEPSRVCDACRKELSKGNFIPGGSSNGENDVIVRKYGETFVNALSQVVGVLEYPKDFIKDSARPEYWVKDCDAPECSICKKPFGTAEELIAAIAINDTENNSRIEMNGDTWRHHCRACGNAVCNNCSMHRRSVPERYWFGDVRICDTCCLDDNRTNIE